jgi:carbamoyl-phosphate synthase large subunit
VLKWHQLERAACIADTFPRAIIRSMRSVEMEFPIESGSGLITVAGEDQKKEMIPVAKKYEKLGFQIYATEGTARILKEGGVNNVVRLGKVRNPEDKPNIMDYLMEGKINIVVNIPRPTIIESKFSEIMEDEYKIRRKSVEFNIPCFTNIELALAIADAIEEYRQTPSRVLSLNEYHKQCLKDVYW